MTTTTTKSDDPLPHQVADLATHDLGEALLALARELWVTKDRLLVLEKILAEQGQLADDAVATYQPSKEFKQQLTQERDRFVNNVLQSFRRKQ